MKIRIENKNESVWYEGEMNLEKLDEFKEYWEEKMSGKYQIYVVTYYINEEGTLCFYPDGPYEC